MSAVERCSCGEPMRARTDGNGWCFLECGSCGRVEQITRKADPHPTPPAKQRKFRRVNGKLEEIKQEVRGSRSYAYRGRSAAFYAKILRVQGAEGTTS